MFWSLPPNEIGDTLSGFAGALAFVWIIVTVWLQSIELAAQREELSLTRSEIEGQRKASENMVKAMEAQVEVFKEQKQQLVFDRVDRHIEELLISARSSLSALPRTIHWIPDDLPSRPGIIQSIRRNFDDLDPDTTWSLNNSFFASDLEIMIRSKSNYNVRNEISYDILAPLENHLTSLVELGDQASMAMKVKLLRLQIRRLQKSFCTAMEAGMFDPRENEE